MTEPSLCKKSYFGDYLRYRLSRMKGFLIVGIFINLAVLPLQGISMIIRVNHQYNTDFNINHTAMMYMLFASVMATLIGVVFTMAAATSSYAFFCRKETTDTLGGLPLTYKERFWGDFLGGLIPTVGTFIPCAVIGVILAAVSQSRLDTFTVNNTYVDIMPFFIGVTLTMFFAYLFTYLLTTLAAMCCGRISSMIVFSVLSFAAIPILAISIAKLITLDAPGRDDSFVDIAQQLSMPAGLFLGNIPKAANMMLDEYNNALLVELSKLDFAIIKPIFIIALSVLAIIILALAYFSGKGRKTENTGRMFARIWYFHAIVAELSAGGFFIAACLLRNSKFDLTTPIGIGVAAVVTVIFEVIRRPRVRGLVNSAACWVVTAACCVGITLLLNATGSFGLIKIPNDIENVTIEFTDSDNVRSRLKITDKAEIAEFLETHNQTVIKKGKFLRNPGTEELLSSFLVTYTLDGMEQHRFYVGCEAEFANNVKSLSFYSERAADFITDEISAASACLSDVYEVVYIPNDKLTKFAETLQSEIEALFDNDAEVIGSVTVVVGGETNTFSVLENYSETIRLIHEYGDAEIDPDAAAIRFSLYEYEWGSNGIDYIKDNIYSIELLIRNRDLDDSKVKELLSLLKIGDESSGGYSEEIAAGMRGTTIYLSSGNSLSYYIPSEDIPRAASLIMQIALESVE